jgi:hypothetical protein
MSSLLHHLRLPSQETPSLLILLSESDLLYYCRFTDNQFILATSLLRLTTSNFIFQLNTCGYSPYVTSSLTTGWICRLELLLVLASRVTQVRVPRDSPHFTASDSRLPQPEGSGPCIYILQELGGPVIHPDTGFPFRLLLRLAGLRWRY